MTHRWYFLLAGHPWDAEQLSSGLTTSDLRVVDRDGQPHLCGERFDQLECDAAYNAAQEVVAILNQVFAVAGDDFSPVALAGAALEVRPDGTTQQNFFDAVTETVTARVRGELSVDEGTPALPGMTLAERALRAAEVEPFFRVALRLCAADRPTFADLFVAFETIKQRGAVGKRARKPGAEHMVAHGWATDDELRDLAASAHPHRHGQPPDPLEPGRREMTIGEARELIRRLLTRWAQELVP